MQGEFIIYPQKLKQAAEEYQSMCRLLSHAADRISDIEKELVNSSYDGIRDTLCTLHDSIICHTVTLQQFETILYDCATEYHGTEERLHTAFSSENSSQSADSRMSALENAISRKGDISIPEPVKELLDALQTDQDAFLSEMEKEGLAAALKNMILPAVQFSSDLSVSNTLEKYLAEELRDNEIHLRGSEAFRLFGTDETFMTDSTFADSNSSMDSCDVSGNYENSGSSAAASSDFGSSGGSGGSGAASSGSGSSGTASGDSGNSGGSDTASGASDGSNHTSAGSANGNSSTAKWSKTSPVLTAANGGKSYGTYATGNQPFQTAVSKTTSVPNTTTAETTAEASPASALFSEHAGSSILTVAALGTAGVMGAGLAHKSKNKTE